MMLFATPELAYAWNHGHRVVNAYGAQAALAVAGDVQAQGRRPVFLIEDFGFDMDSLIRRALPNAAIQHFIHVPVAPWNVLQLLLTDEWARILTENGQSLGERMLYETLAGWTAADTLKKIHKKGITVSTIASGADDRGIQFLKDIATFGGGKSYVAEKATDLPGLLLTSPIRDFLNAGESIPKGALNAIVFAQRDAFPSGHAEMTLISLYLAHHYRLRSRFGRWVIRDKSTGDFHGWVELSKLSPWSGPSDEIALSYVLRRTSWGRGIATDEKPLDRPCVRRARHSPPGERVQTEEGPAGTRPEFRCGWAVG